MRFIKFLPLIRHSKMCIRLFSTNSHFFAHKYSSHGLNSILKNRVSTSAAKNIRIPHDEATSDEEIDTKGVNSAPHEGHVRLLLYKHSNDVLIHRLQCCASVQELLNVFDKNHNYYKCEHTAQTILVLYDLMEIYKEMSDTNMKNPSKAGQLFFKKLEGNDSFLKLLALCESKAIFFDIEGLSYCVSYLSKLGLDVETPTMQKLCEILKKKLLDEFSGSAASRYLDAVFRKNSLRSYFMSQDLIPSVFNAIDSCDSALSLNYLSVSLNKLHHVVPDEYLDKYKNVVEDFIENGRLRAADYKVVLQVIAFLNYPKWREKNSLLISKCILLIQSSFKELNINEILLLYEIFFKLAEPGEILNDLQRCTYKYFYQQDDVFTQQKISLFSTIIFFSPPHLRNDFIKKVNLYVNDCNDYDSLLLLRKVLSNIKISDVKTCHLYWKKILNFLKTDPEIDLIKLCQNYINFSIDIDNYRHPEFEKEMLKKLQTLTQEPQYDFFPQKIANILNFALLYSDDGAFLGHLVAKLEANWGQLKAVDCLRLSYTLNIFYNMDKKYPKLSYARRVSKVLNQFIRQEVGKAGFELWKNSALLKSCVYINRVDAPVVDKLLDVYRNSANISSKNMENVYYCFLKTDTLIPEILDNFVEYILKYKSHVLGFNVGRISYLCYLLGYQPKNLSKFCATAVDIIIRDQERMSGLLVIYSALALCFFNKLPNSLIKTIFNVEFMDKLDDELQQCYSKDKYPKRVREYLMLLNRAVCLDYPESNVPWFHQKYVDESLKARSNKPTLFATKVKEYLSKILQNKNTFVENVITPYGYSIDFVIYLDNKGESAESESQTSKKLALLLIPEFAYTKVVPRLKGIFQMKKRHLEILGYRVVLIKFSDWIGLYYPEERMEFLKGVIWPKTFSESNNILVNS